MSIMYLYINKINLASLCNLHCDERLTSYKSPRVLYIFEF